MLKTKTFWRIHSILGLITGIPLLIISFTGSALVFKDEINYLLLPEHTISTPSFEGRLPFQALYEKLEAALNNYVIAGWVVYDPPKQADYVYIIPKGTDEWHHVYIDQYSGDILGEPLAENAEIMDWILDLHYTLLAGDVGVVIVGIIAVLMMTLGVSGVVIYKGFWKSLFKMKWRSSLRQFSANLHKRIGIISAPIFLILGFTGGWWNISHIVHEILEPHEHHEVDQLYMSETINLDSLLLNAQKEIPSYSVHYIAFPMEEGENINFYGDLDTDHALRSPYGSIASFDAQSGNFVSGSHIGDLSIYPQVLDTFRPLHYGTFAGIWSKIIWCVVGASPGVLAVSGFYIWWHRISKKCRQGRRSIRSTS